MRIGIDVGGTHTDAVLLRGDDILAATKSLTSADAVTGIVSALDTILQDGAVRPEQIDMVMIGTTQFTNAIVERRELSPTAVIRIALPAGKGLPPMTGWPADLATKMGGHTYMLRGGYLYDGMPIAELEDDDIDIIIADLVGKGIESIAIASAFSPMNASPEKYVAARILKAIPQARITLSHVFNKLGLIERENAAILNTTLLSFAERVTAAFLAALIKRDLNCPVFISQNDGTLMSAEFVTAYPALTFASGPTNSLRGAYKLTGLEDAIVVDIGGTTSDIGVLKGGFPRESNNIIDVGGVRTNFRMPDILAIGLGGGSKVGADGSSIGPQSVGHQLVKEGLVFGGGVLTATDILVASGAAEIGDVEAVQSLDPKLVETAQVTMHRMLDESIEMMKPGGKPMPVILVGGGSVLVTHGLKAASQLYCPENAGVANAIGAAIAQIGGEAEQMVSYRSLSREDAIAQVTHEAKENAIKAGAAPATIRTVEIEETTVPYMEGDSTRINIKVIGEVDTDRLAGAGA
jgi:N-methylhydantoinase A/oxoprolinase/acetone carboxylase beta subunit